MDPITIGVTVGTTVVSQLTKKLMAKAADPEKVAKAVNWVFSAASNLFKVRKKERPIDALIPKPPTENLMGAVQDEVSDIEVEAQTNVVKDVVAKLEEESVIDEDDGVHLSTFEDFKFEQLAKEAESLLKQIETYLGNLRFEEEKAAQFGGLTFAPPIVMNTIRIQQQEIVKRVLRLSECMEKAYGVDSVDLDILYTATQN